MAETAALGEAQVAIRATMEKLDGDLSGAKSKIGSVMGGIASTLGNIGLAGFGAFGAAATTAVGAVAGVGIALGNLSKDAAQLEGLRNAFETISQSAGTTGDEMLAALEKGSGGTVAARDLMLSFNKAASLVSTQFATELPDAMRLVAAASAATGQDMGFLMDSLVTGVGRLSPMILDNLGIQVSLTDATEAYAETIGKSASELSKTEQQEAVRLLTMSKLEEKYGEMEGVYDTAAAKMQQQAAAFQNAKDAMGTAFMPVLTSVMEKLTELANDLLPVILPLVEGFASGIMTVFDALSPLIPLFVTFAEKIGEVIETFMAGDISTAMEMFGDALSGLTEGLSEILPELITFGMDIIFSIIEGIIAAIPPLLSTGMEIIMSLVETMLTLLPEIMVTGIDILLALVDGIASMLPELIPTAVKIVIKLVMALIDKLPDIIGAGIDLLFGLIDGILSALPDLVAAIPEIIIAFVTTIVENLPKILESGVEIILALVLGILDALPELVGAIPEIIVAIVEAFKSAGPQFLEAGKNIIEGIKEGVLSAWESLKALFTSLIDGLVGGIKDLLGIESPSKVFADIGKNLNKGLAFGVKVTSDLPEKEIRKMSLDLAPALNNLVDLRSFEVPVSDSANQMSNTTNNYNLTAQYRYQDEMTLTEEIRLLNLLGSVV